MLGDRHSEPLVGLFDFSDYWDMVHAVSQVLDLPEQEVQRRLFYEAIETGWNVSKAARTFGVTPHVYNRRMEEFYKQSDAFVFELLVGHLNRYCQEIDQRVAQAIDSRFGERKALRILVLGDGIGTDSLRFAAMGYDVTYFEFEGYSSALAAYRFRREELNDRITMIHNLKDIPTQQFDVLICREVLEHVSDPPAVIDNIWGYLGDNGIAIITESFGRVEPEFPTHLTENKKYDGKTEFLFVKTGFRLLKSFPDRRPMVFQKTRKSDKSRFKSLVCQRQYVVRNTIRRVGRRLLRLIRF